MRAADALSLSVASVICALLPHGELFTLVSAPAWIMIAVALLLFAGSFREYAMRREYRARAAVSLLFGVFVGMTLYGHDIPPAFGMSTHAIRRPGLFGTRVLSPAESLFSALELLDEDPQKLLGRRIAVSGAWSAYTSRSGSVSKRVMSCCAADALDVGFDVRSTTVVHMRRGDQVLVRGTVGAAMVHGETRYVLDGATVRPAAP